MKRLKLKLDFKELEDQMELLNKDDLTQFQGGSGSSGGWNDCVIEAIAFATGRSYNEVLQSYGSFMYNSTGTGSGSGWQLDLQLKGATT